MPIGIAAMFAFRMVSTNVGCHSGMVTKCKTVQPDRILKFGRELELCLDKL